MREITPTELLNGGIKMKFYVPAFQLERIEESVDKEIMIHTDTMRIIAILDGVSTAKIKKDDEVNIYKRIQVTVMEIYKRNEDDNDDNILRLPDVKEEFNESFIISY